MNSQYAFSDELGTDKNRKSLINSAESEFTHQGTIKETTLLLDWN